MSAWRRWLLTSPNVGGVVCLMLLSCLGSAPSDASQADVEDDLFTLSVDELKKVNITVASSIATRLDLQPATVTVVSGRELLSSGGRTLTEALSMRVPGYYFVDDQDDMIAGFRGLAADNNAKVLLLLNGRNLNIEWFWGAPDAILNSINLKWIDRVEVIRGPGAVKHGQGALLGVINVVTKQGSGGGGDTNAGAHADVSYGADGYMMAALDLGLNQGPLSGYFYLSKGAYDGQPLRREGWALRGHAGYEGGVIADHDHHLFEADNLTAVGHLKNADLGLALDMFYADQTKDLYNMWFDRDVYGERLLSLAGIHDVAFSDAVALKTTLAYARDDFSLATTRGFITGGTREDRYNFVAQLNINQWPDEANRLALGFDIKRIESGKKNADGNNFLLNTLDEATLEALPRANEERTWVLPSTTRSTGLFVEDFYDWSESTTLFAALRYDDHPHWGNKLSPRLGLFYTPTEDWRWRLTYHTGFRGPVGMHYGGGHLRDGFLRASNYGAISAANVIIDGGALAQDLPETKPEQIKSLELALDNIFSEQLQSNIVLFYNRIENVIDVGAFLPPGWTASGGTSFTPLPPIGSDISADGWGGYWFYKNTNGSIRMWGLEAELKYQQDWYSVLLSHALVKAISADDLTTSMYVTPDERVRAYPENVTRLQVTAQLAEPLTLTCNYLYDYRWYSSRNHAVDGNHILNLALDYRLTDRLRLSLIGKNLLDSDELYVMNNNPGSDIIADGTPSLERRSWWLNLSLSLQ